MKTQHHIVNANQAVARIAYKTNEVFPIYPITPASEMSEWIEQQSAKQETNIFGQVPLVFQMQSEGGVAGAMHGAIQTGSLSSTFTSSQGLLLMLPNMYKIAGELTPNVIHVATRSIATHALSVFGDHSDIMAVRQSGYAMLGSASVQEAQDMALIAQASTLHSKLPFIHFFDGFRTSHETAKINSISDDVIKAMLSTKAIEQHQKRALNPNNPVLRGTSQEADVFFQNREAQNIFYNNCPKIVQNTMHQFEQLTGRAYKLFDYVGHEKAEHIIVSMASSTETIETTINHLNEQGNRFGLIKVRLFRPFSTKHLIKMLPETAKSIAVLDRTKESGSAGEPLYLDVLQSISNAYQNNNIQSLPKIVGGRYGLSSKEFTPAMVNTIFNNLKQKQPKHNFTVGIIDDVTNLSLKVEDQFYLNSNAFEAIFNEGKSKNETNGFNQLLQHIGNKHNTFVQGYTAIDYKKSNSTNSSYLRINNKSIKAPYAIKKADFIACQNVNFTFNNFLDTLKNKSILLINTSLSSKAFWQSLTANQQYQIIEKKIQLYRVNIEEIKENNILKTYQITELQACFLALQSQFLYTDDIVNIKEFIYKVDTSKGYKEDEIIVETEDIFSQTLLGKMLQNKGNDIPVSLLPADGTFNTDTSKYNIPQESATLPEWNTEVCIQCGACSMACPQAALRTKVLNDKQKHNAPKDFKTIPSNDFDLIHYTIQINTNQCNGCNNCVDACPAKALVQKPVNDLKSTMQKHWEYSETIPEFDRTKINPLKVSEQQLQEPLFRYSSGVEGCGEAPYLKILSQLFGNRLLVANATGASSIFGGALPTTPWSKNSKGQGPAWSNSLFEDNAEFGLGFRLSLNQKQEQAKQLLLDLCPLLDFDFVNDILKASQNTEKDIEAQRERVMKLKSQLKDISSYKANELLKLADNLANKNVWIIGGDGWAYDIGFGGIDHVLASGENVNILVLDNEVYDNTGGQTSKATPFGAQAKFSYNGKRKQKKDLGQIAMTYDNVYVASVAIGANQEQTLKAFNEAESYNGPSIIIAYTHSYSHGIDMKNPSQYHKATVASGQWVLYRNDPRKAREFQLDSPVPSIKIEDYLKLENRYSKVLEQATNNDNLTIFNIQKQIDKRFNFYLNKATNMPLNRAKMLQKQKILLQFMPKNTKKK